jgi:hypothetical protein
MISYTTTLSNAIKQKHFITQELQPLKIVFLVQEDIIVSKKDN